MRYDWRIIAVVTVVAALVGWYAMRTVGGDDVDLDEIDRDLATLSQTLRADQTVESDLLPQGAAQVVMPNAMQYSRVIQFWAPALASGERRERRRRLRP